MKLFIILLAFPLISFASRYTCFTSDVSKKVVFELEYNGYGYLEATSYQFPTEAAVSIEDIKEYDIDNEEVTEIELTEGDEAEYKIIKDENIRYFKVTKKDDSKNIILSNHPKNLVFNSLPAKSIKTHYCGDDD